MLSSSQTFIGKVSLKNMSDFIVEGLSYAYKNKKKEIHRVFADASLAWNHGESLAIIGSSGSGKTTFLRLLAGLLDAAGGSFRIDGSEVIDIKPSDRDVAFLFQETVLYPHLTVYGNLLLALNDYGLSRVEKDQMAQRMLEETNLLDYINFKPRQLSEGQKQVLSLARALIRKPELLLADEPFSSLDPIRKETLFEMMFEHAKREKTAIVASIHDIIDARRFDRVYSLEGGVFHKIR